MTQPEDNSARNLRLLVTRPAHQAENLCNQLSALGATCLLLPTIDIVPTDAAEQMAATFKTHCVPDYVIFVSANAVSPVMPYWPASPNNFLVFAIGSGTANALKNFSIPAIVPAQQIFNSEILLAMSELHAVDGKKITIFSGKNGRNLLKDTLQARGAQVTQIEVYQRSCPSGDFNPTFASWQSQTISAIISTSAESLKNLCAMASPRYQAWLRAQQLLVISEKMRLMAQSLGFIKPPIVAESASDLAIVAAVQQKLIHLSS